MNHPRSAFGAPPRGGGASGPAKPDPRRLNVKVRYFASLREALGSGEGIDLPAGTTIGQLRALLVARSPAHASALAPGKALRCALNQTLCDESDLVAEGAEVAFFPPVTGG